MGMPPIGDEYAAYPRNYGPGSFDPGPRRVRIDAIGDAWRVMSADWGTWVLVTLSLIGVSIVASMPLIIYSFIRRGMTQADPFAYTPEYYAVAAVCACFSQFLIGVATDAFIYFGLRRHRGEFAPFGQAFNFSGRFGALVAAEAIMSPLAILALVGGFAVQGTTSGQAPFDRALAMLGGQAGGSLVAAMVFAFAAFVPLLVLDQGMSPAEAFRTSFQTAGPKIVPIVGLLIAAGFLSGVGFLACFVGGLFTYPILLLTKAILYHDFFRLKAAAGPAPAEYGMTPPGA